MGIKKEREGGSRPLFETEEAKRRMAYKLYVTSIAVSVCLILWYRANNIPRGSEEGRWVWVGMMVAELLFAFYWVITQSVRWNPIYRRTFKERLSERYGSNELPGVDIFICTADPIAEPPTLVMSTVLSIMAYDYSPEKLSVYLSDDAGSIITFYALWEASHFAKHWLPYCKKFKVEPRSPAVYFSRSYDSLAICNFSEWSAMKSLYEEMVDRINSVAMRSNIPEELKHHEGFSEWILGMTSRDHPPILRIISDMKDRSSIDADGNVHQLWYTRHVRSDHGTTIILKLGL